MESALKWVSCRKTMSALLLCMERSSWERFHLSELTIHLFKDVAQWFSGVV